MKVKSHLMTQNTVKVYLADLPATRKAGFDSVAEQITEVIEGIDFKGIVEQRLKDAGLDKLGAVVTTTEL